MQILNIDQNTQEWLDARKGKITGSKLRGIIVKRGAKRKIGFYELMAEKIGIQDESEDAMDRGHRLEEEAIELFEEKIGKKVERVGLCLSDDNPEIALSPDGLIKIDDKYKEAVEVKCLSSARHLEAYFEKSIPGDYEEQIIQYFIVNSDLEKLYFVCYDPRLTTIPLVIIEVNRSEIEDKIKQYKEYQINALLEINAMLEGLLF